MIINDSIVSEGFVVLFIKSSCRYNFYTGIKDIYTHYSHKLLVIEGFIIIDV